MGLGELSPVAFSEDALTSTVLAPKPYRARQPSGDRDIHTGYEGESIAKSCLHVAASTAGVLVLLLVAQPEVPRSVVPYGAQY